MAHSLPADIPSTPGREVQRTPKTPRGSKLEPRFYPVVKDATQPDPQVCVHTCVCLYNSELQDIT